MVLLKLLFFTGCLLLLFFFCRYRTFFPHVFVISKTSNTSEEHKYQEDRVEKVREVSWLSPISPEGFFGQIVSLVAWVVSDTLCTASMACLGTKKLDHSPRAMTHLARKNPLFFCCLFSISSI